MTGDRPPPAMGLSAQGPARPPTPRLRRVLRLGGAALLGGAAALGLRASVGQSYRVSSGSMLPTLQPQDRAWVDKTAYGLRLPGAAPGARVSPRRGDVIVFRASGEEARQGPAELVKRVIGLPGDRIDFEDGRPVVNGWPIPACDVGVYFHMSAERLTRGRLVVEFLGDEAYLTVREPGGRPFVGYTVRPGELFVLGDNRGLSNDSRSWNGQRGAGVPLSAVLGQVRRVLYGFDRDGAFAWRRVGAALGPEVDLSGVDVRPLVEGVAECLARRPPQTLPPAPLVAGRGG